jgi:GAF domain-containing protein
MPIKLQDQTIGLIQLHDTEHQRHWSELDLALVNSVAAQVAQAAENLRLFDETRERAGREQMIREISEKLRAAPDLERLVEIATAELGERLAAKYTKLELGFEKNPDNGNGQY